MRIIKNDHFGKKVWEYDGQIVERTASSVLVQAHFNRTDLMFNGILFREGDRFLELYPYGKWFNIYEIHDKDSDLVKGWYCNVTRPARVSEKQIAYDDLALDLLVYTDRKILVLDEDQFLRLSLTRAEVRQAENAIKELKDIFSQSKAFQMQAYKEYF